VNVEVSVEAGAWDVLDLEPLAARAVAAALARSGLDPAAWEVSLLACDDARIAALNATFRGKARPTNVLSWPSAERGAAIAGTVPAPPAPGDGDPELGDIALAYETCAREAREAGRPLCDHVTHLVVHATLHLLGYNHETDADAALMEGREVEILASLGVPDPYSGAER
jgi:probable rRNA maturation factor